MAKKERQKRSARQARAQKRAELEAAHATTVVSAGDAKKADASAKSQETKPAEAAKKPGRVRSYFQAVKAEMHRVVWPSREELKNYSVAVIAMLIIFGVAVWVVDTGVAAALVGFAGLRG